MKKIFAVAMTAAFVLPAAATSAAAQDETITVEGLFYIDRNGDNAFNEGESVRANGNGVAIRVQGSTELVGTYPTGPDGRYKAVLPKGPKYTISNIDMTDYSTTKVAHGASESSSGLDFPLRGYFLNGFTFVDANGDGVKQADEKTHSGKVKVTGRTRTGADFSAETAAGPDGAYRLDLPMGTLNVVAPGLQKDRLTLAEPKSDKDVDWLTGTRAVPESAEREFRVDLRYVNAAADIALESALSPVKDSYTLGEQIDVKLTLSNKGNVPIAPTFALGSFSAKLLSHSDNVTVRPGTDDDFAVKDKILPGRQLEVTLKIELNDLEYQEVHAMARFIFDGLPDTNHKNNVAVKPIKVVEKSTAPTTSTTTAAPTTTTTAVVAQAGSKSGLASTGASVFGPLTLGAVLLVAGAGAFFVARRRRS
ncbi:LPXTG cell wall anchor domain-containing protein [Lentzea sp. NPDC058436]|uniref:LPXTG cell wall anchor domain-containing protein n=1 Tax=Lentzea sp. NPDC058436 TaxID=3346499 RepID=UPI00364D7A9F